MEALPTDGTPLGVVAAPPDTLLGVDGAVMLLFVPGKKEDGVRPVIDGCSCPLYYSPLVSLHCSIPEGDGELWLPPPSIGLAPVTAADEGDMFMSMPVLLW